MKALLILIALVSITHNVNASTINSASSSFDATIKTQSDFEKTMVKNGMVKTERSFIKSDTITAELAETKNESSCLSLLESYGIEDASFENYSTDQCLDQAY